MHRRVGPVIAISLAAAVVVVVLGMRDTSQVVVASGPGLEWPEGPANPPRLVCPRGSVGASYDGPGFSDWRDPKGAVLEIVPEMSNMGAGYTGEDVARITRTDLVQLWRHRTRDTNNELIPLMAGATIGVKINGSFVATYAVSRVPYAGGKPIRWRDAGWVVEGAEVCEV